MNIENTMQAILNEPLQVNRSFYKDILKVLVALHFSMLEKTEISESLIKEFNVHIRKILGNGQSLKSCLQFAEVKNAQHSIKLIDREISQLAEKLNQSSFRGQAHYDDE